MSLRGAGLDAAAAGSAALVGAAGAPFRRRRRHQFVDPLGQLQLLQLVARLQGQLLHGIGHCKGD